MMTTLQQEQAVALLSPAPADGQPTSAPSGQPSLPAWEASPLNYRELLRKNPALELVLSLGPGITWILHVPTGRYDFVSNNAQALLGYSSQELIKGEVGFLATLIHPADFSWLQALLWRTQDHVQTLPPRQRLYHRVSFDCRVRKSDGSYIRVLNQVTVLQTDDEGAVTHLLGSTTDITNWKKRETLVATVHEADGGSGPVYTSAEGLPAPQTTLSKRECEIVKLLAQGLSSKQIADRLFISRHTVSTHRQNIIEKTGSKNTGELVHRAMGRGLI
ncbi:hypothetical protein BH24BAC1_BH24BAC1_41460 [soil metagenome]